MSYTPHHLQTALGFSRVFTHHAELAVRFDGTQGFQCSKCHVVKPCWAGTGTGYAYDAGGRLICYACCASDDEARMRREGRIMLYLGEGRSISNWPGTLKFKAYSLKTGRHNIARSRVDVWFKHEGRDWHGVQYGDNTQVLHCRRLK